MKTKRRKVWVSEQAGYSGYVYYAKQDADDAGCKHTTKYVEARPGDVVLSREDVEARAYAAARYLRERGLTGVGAHAVDAVADLVAQFIRGGR